MSEPREPAARDAGADAVEVSALLLCREVVQGRTGVSLRDVLEIVPVLGFPGEAGPLSFAAFLRPLRAGEAEVAFRIHPMDHPETTLVRMPGRLNVQKGYEGRQTVVSAGFKTLKINAGGWFGVEFSVGAKVLARTRFAVGAVQPKKSDASPPAAAPPKA